jgi:TetR/AcrR family acrAB operon transcriptional repressor
MRQQSIRFHRDLEMTLLNARNHGQLPSHADPKRLAILMHCMLDGYIINWLHFPEYINLEEEIDFMLDTLFGLFTIQRVDNDILTPNA